MAFKVECNQPEDTYHFEDDDNFEFLAGGVLKVRRANKIILYFSPATWRTIHETPPPFKSGVCRRSCQRRSSRPAAAGSGSGDDANSERARWTAARTCAATAWIATTQVLRVRTRLCARIWVGMGKVSSQVCGVGATQPCG